MILTEGSLPAGLFEERPEQGHELDPAVAMGLLPQTASAPRQQGGPAAEGGGSVGQLLSTAAAAVVYFWQGGR